MIVDKKIAILLLLASVFMIGTVTAATPDILINPPFDIIQVGVDPNAVSPPLEFKFLDWGVNLATYHVVLKRESDGKIWDNCEKSGSIPGNGFNVELPDCKIPASEVGVPYKAIAEASCPNCAPHSRSKTVILDANVNPVPELSTVALMSAGLIGLFGLVRFRRKD